MRPVWMNAIESAQKEDDQAIAIRYLDKVERLHEISYRQLGDDIQHAIAWLYQNVKPIQGAHIGILANNSYHYVVCLLAVICTGGVAIPLNTQNSLSEIRYETALAEITFLLYDGIYGRLEPDFEQEYREFLLPIDGYTHTDEKKKWSEPEPSDMAMMIFTSGTTGKSKAVVLNAFAANAWAKGYSEFFYGSLKNVLREPINFYLCHPLYHAYSIGLLMSSLSNEYTVCMNVDIGAFVRDINALSCNCSAMVPATIKILTRLLKRGRRESVGGIRDILCEGAALDMETITYMRGQGIHITLGYGLTENTICTMNHLSGDEPLSSPGSVCPHSQIRIIDGEVLVKSDSMMDGYYKDPEATAQVIRDGWLHTGDLGEIDEDGYLYLTGRKKNLIILDSGENVSPEELEALLSENALIQEVIVKEKNHQICAEVYCREDDRLPVEDFIEKVNGEIAMYKRITLVEFRDEPFPKTGSGKIKRNL